MRLKTKAFDKEGNEYPKDVTVSIKFGWPAEYELSTLLKHYPFKRDFCIDIGGRNHKGIPEVTIPAKKMDSLFESIFVTLADGMNKRED